MTVKLREKCLLCQSYSWCGKPCMNAPKAARQPATAKTKPAASSPPRRRGRPPKRKPS